MGVGRQVRDIGWFTVAVVGTVLLMLVLGATFALA